MHFSSTMLQTLLVYLSIFALVTSLDCSLEWEYGVPNEHNIKSPTDVRRKLIVAGEESTPHEYPWQVKISTGSITCGGAIIGRRWIITAAHCAEDRTASVALGLGSIIVYGTFIVHEDYDDKLIINDIALIYLPIDLPCDNPNIRAISLAERSNQFDINDCSAWATGFGHLYSGGFYPEHEYDNFEVQTRVYDTDECNDSPENVYEIPESQICAFTPGFPAEDTCQGDSGGPLVVDVDLDETAHRYLQIGITSYGSGCGHTAGIYTDISRYKQWILSKYPEAVFTPLNACDRNHYNEGIVQCVDEECQLRLPQCISNANSWRSTEDTICTDYHYDHTNTGCYSDKSTNGIFAYQICHQCANCIGANGENSDWSGDPNNNGAWQHVLPKMPSINGECPPEAMLTEIELYAGYWGYEMSWNVDDEEICRGSGHFTNQENFVGECCLREGRHLLNCIDSYGDGWNAGYVVIQGQILCSGFIAGEKFQDVFILSNTTSFDDNVDQEGPICLEIALTTTTWANEISWSFASCESGLNYVEHSTFHEQCCVNPGNFTLRCLDLFGDGWHGGYITIGSERFCDDFLSGLEQGVVVNIDGNGQVISSSSTTTTTTLLALGCDALCIPEWIGDGICDSISCWGCVEFSDERFFDGGDCESSRFMRHCFDITIQTSNFASEISWSLHECGGSQYTDDSEFASRCCLAPGQYTLSCMDYQGDGWHGAVLILEGFTFCQNFLTGHSQSMNIQVLNSGDIHVISWDVTTTTTAISDGCHSECSLSWIGDGICDMKICFGCFQFVVNDIFDGGDCDDLIDLTSIAETSTTNIHTTDASATYTFHSLNTVCNDNALIRIDDVDVQSCFLECTKYAQCRYFSHKIPTCFLCYSTPSSFWQGAISFLIDAATTTARIQTSPQPSYFPSIQIVQSISTSTVSSTDIIQCNDDDEMLELAIGFSIYCTTIALSGLCENILMNRMVKDICRFSCNNCDNTVSSTILPDVSSSHIIHSTSFPSMQPNCPYTVRNKTYHFEALLFLINLPASKKYCFVSMSLGESVLHKRIRLMCIFYIHILILIFLATY